MSLHHTRFENIKVLWVNSLAAIFASIRALHVTGRSPRRCHLGTALSCP